MADEWRLKGNAAFQTADYPTAEEYYKMALELDPNSHILYTNLAASLLEQKKYTEAIDAANKAILIDSTWLKAYFRKGLAFEYLGRTRDAFLTWSEAMNACENTPWLKKQYDRSKLLWMNQFRVISIESSSDLLERYCLLTDSREKLSTLAHFWNISTPEERMNHFLFFIKIIGGQTPIPEESLNLSMEMMQPMPMHNYHDLPLERIQSWCNFFHSLDSNSKTHLLERFWNALTSKEQNDVILDLQVFMSQAQELSR